MKYINNKGITRSTAEISRNVCEKNDWCVDMLEDGNWLVSNQNTKIGLFSDLEDAIFFFMAKSEPIEQLTEQEVDEALDWLEKQLMK